MLVGGLGSLSRGAHDHRGAVSIYYPIATFPETVCVTVYGSDLEKFSEVVLPIPDGAFGIRIARPEKEIFL